MKMIKSFFLLALLLSLCSCSTFNPREVSNLEKNEETAIEKRPSIEAETREPIFVYNQSQNQPKNIYLTIHDKPRLIGENYVRLLGVVMGSNFPVALIEIGGKEKCLRHGEDCNGYWVSSITGKGIQLIRKGK